MKLPVQERYLFLTELHDRLDRIASPAKLLTYFVRRAADLLGAESGGVWLHDRVSDRMQQLAAFGPERISDAAPLGIDQRMPRAVLRGHRPTPPASVLAVPLPSGGRVRGAILLSRPARPFERSEERFLAKAAARVGEEIRQREELRLRDVRARIEGKLLEDLRPENVVYRILHGLKALLRYDHSSAVWLLDESREALMLTAEQIAWKKAKSARIGCQVPVSPAAVVSLARGEAATLFRFREGVAQEPAPEAARALLQLATCTGYSDSAPQEGAVLLAPLRYRSRPIGLLKITSQRPSAFDERDLEVVRAFSVPSASALHRSQARVRLETSAVRAERKNALAEVARAVAHDVNNAVGAALPVVQHLIDEVEGGRARQPDALRADLSYVLASLRIVKRVFSGMLGFARDVRSREPVDVNRCVRDTLALLEGSLSRRGIRLESSLADGLAPVRGNIVLLEQVLLNLVGNARDATPRGGVIRVATAPAEEGITLAVEDNGAGIEPHALERVGEPFYTTKPEGTGLGIAICRSILEDMGGRFSITSATGRGTQVRVLLPAITVSTTAEPAALREEVRP
jgi:signal transduction histidine kinase